MDINIQGNSFRTATIRRQTVLPITPTPPGIADQLTNENGATQPSGWTNKLSGAYISMHIKSPLNIYRQKKKLQTEYITISLRPAFCYKRSSIPFESLLLLSLFKTYFVNIHGKP